jgi:hypothetical protein
MKGYKFLGIITILQVVFSLYGKLKEKLDERKSKSEQPTLTGITRKNFRDQINPESDKKCVLCLENRTDVTSTTCGHLHCW